MHFYRLLLICLTGISFYCASSVDCKEAKNAIFKLALKQVKEDLVESAIAEFVVDCYYRVGQKNWKKFPSHSCNRLDTATRMVSQNGAHVSKRQVRIARAFKVVSVDQRKAEEGARTCLNKWKTKSTTRSQSCKGLTWHLPKNPKYKGALKRLYYERIQAKFLRKHDGNTRNGNKRKAPKGKFTSTQNDTQVDRKPKAKSLRALVNKCFAHRTENEHFACFGITWGSGYPFEAEEETIAHLYKQLNQESDEAPIENVKASSPSVNSDCKARAHVQHCFKYHQWEPSYRHRCDGISFDLEKSPKTVEDIRNRAYLLLVEAETELRIKVALKDTPDYGKAISCLYTTSWRRKPQHECNRWIFAMGTEGKNGSVSNDTFTEHDNYMHELLHETRFVHQVMDCFLHYGYHIRTDHACYEATWIADPANRENVKLSEKQKKIIQIWNAFEKLQKEKVLKNKFLLV